MGKRRWVRVMGDGLAWEGKCLLERVILVPDADGDYVDVYDGRDKETGKKFARVKTASTITRNINLGAGVEFGTGIYVDGYDTAVETTVVFTPLS